MGSLRPEGLCGSQVDGLRDLLQGRGRGPQTTCPGIGGSPQRGLWSGPKKGEEDILYGRAPIRKVCVTLAGYQESGKASWKSGQLCSQVRGVVRDGEGVRAPYFFRVSQCSALSRGE